MENQQKYWEEVVSKDDVIQCKTHRAKVPSGWLYRVCSGYGVALAFVPDEYHDNDQKAKTKDKS